MDIRAAWEAELEKLGIDPVVDGEFLDWLWEDVCQEFTEEDLTNPARSADTSEHLVALAERSCNAYLRFDRGAGAGGRPAGSTSGDDLSGSIKFDPKTRTEVRALSEYLAKVLSVEREVMAFRRRFLGAATRTLETREVPGVLRSWALPHDVPRSDDDVLLNWTGGDAHSTRFRGARRSPIGDLDRLAKHFAERYPWSADRVMHLTLCGGVLQVNTIRGRPRIRRQLGPPAHKFHRDTITLEVEASMPAELVQKAYSLLQHELRGGSKPRRGSERNTEVFRFVVSHSRLRILSEVEYLGKLELAGTWEELREAWDGRLHANHSWRYGEGGTRNFQRDFIRGQKAVTGMSYGLSVPGEPMTIAESKARFDEFLESLSDTH